MLGVALGAPDVVVSVLERGVPGVTVGGGGVVGGDADGTRSPGRSLTRSLGASVQAVARVATNARAETPNSTLFMNAPPRSVRILGTEKQGGCHRRRACRYNAVTEDRRE